ncbi:hypothetical protein [Saccharopolyspora phatthalungensis]|uniref:Uncharacterized protein n=1 Tax=Saccharopolyspora phatthalungensis TaxID=664693 RepID=A0A840PVV5_9PSEU|nr:hypothetical protein [Saccharopolyspora phatthalungensis]MBB5154402.1 hypothetical protein [Saccharopolyspora phatthalungensis]
MAVVTTARRIRWSQRVRLERLNVGDVEGLVASYERDVVLVVQVVRTVGHRQIRASREGSCRPSPSSNP